MNNEFAVDTLFLESSMETNMTVLLEFARKTAIEAGRIIIDEREKNNLSLDYKGGIELVTSADLKADEYICNRIKKEYAHHKILSEESSSSFDDFETALWIIDPIDGTINYAHNQPNVAVSIAFAIEGNVKVGVVHCPFTNETFYASKGNGSFLNGSSIKSGCAPDLKKSIIATGFPYDKSDIDGLMKRLGKILVNCQGMRRGGSAAIDICWVAMGRLDGYYETVKVWDMAAATLVAREAGAIYGNFIEVEPGIPEDLRSHNMLVAAPLIYENLFSLLSE